ncbi:DUF1877 family protein [Ferrovibrio sp.]|uniref:DUF1877 family protein n=1 Tax=Ferrovibrio sp. TaxID=1917215 RepID=UPI000CCA51BD|nr:DUF1877 family protein [Ferrovibrio sp.]PJI44317.1 MAG: hypothetical protein CTR53_00985 [Ferrovibrio sp.]
MAARGGYFAITADQKARLMALTTGADRAEYLNEIFDEVPYQDLDKAWYTIHRALANYPSDPYGLSDEMDAQYASYPLKLAIYGGQDINVDGDDGWILRLIEPHQIADLVQAMEGLDEESLKQKYWASNSLESHCEYGEDDLEYTLGYFEEARDFLKQMAGTGRTVIFLADQ